MTDKQIIDGIDVRDCCEWYSLPDGKLYCRINNKGDFTCKSNPDCQFKQLARAKQENKKLEKIINKSAERFCNDYLETFKENERLKSELQAKELELIMAKADLCRGCQYKNDYKAKEQECKKLKHKVELMMDCASCKVDEYKQTLAEIKEICNSVENIENINSLYDAKLSGMYLQAHKILQKLANVR